MKRAVLAVMGTVCGLVLLLSFKTHPAAGTGAVATTGAGADPGAASTPGTGSAGSGGKTRTVTGDTVDTRWGPVQVQVTLDDGKITKVQAVQLPSDNPRDLEINNFAVPQLEQEALSAQNSQIDMVSGATYTSQGYIQSLQSALDKAGK
ncbi:FMN-binding protein [Actinoallomurus iriomotensis]|uniref:FMN-binding protein n=1 Tax=Actinoallomurus iriomotensis TaxID=478107 RepID=A0A9W6W0E8_9ACTN|nr:FMN-binding protein [Actinoallomurus iriomotensis]GLY92228.1 FMN-binding protein [Actinoallomurus iriomotensis]